MFPTQVQEGPNGSTRLNCRFARKSAHTAASLTTAAGNFSAITERNTSGCGQRTPPAQTLRNKYDNDAAPIEMRSRGVCLSRG